MKRKRSSRQQALRLTHGSVHDDLVFSPADRLDLKVKAEIYRDLMTYICQSDLTQQELAAALGVHQPAVSNLLHGRVANFSIGRLLRLAGRLNFGAHVNLTAPEPPSSQTLTHPPSPGEAEPTQEHEKITP